MNTKVPTRVLLSAPDVVRPILNTQNSYRFGSCALAFGAMTRLAQYVRLSLWLGTFASEAH